MPHEVIQYSCDICHRKYFIRDDAERCEKEHFTPTGLVKYNSGIWLDGKYPDTISIQLSNYYQDIIVWGGYKLIQKPLLPGVDYPDLKSVAITRI